MKCSSVGNVVIERLKERYRDSTADDFLFLPLPLSLPLSPISLFSPLLPAFLLFLSTFELEKII